MDWGLVAGIAALCGVVVNFIRIGQWQGRIETRVDKLEAASEKQDKKLEVLANLINKQNELLTEIKVKIDLVFAGKGRKNG